MNTNQYHYILLGLLLLCSSVLSAQNSPRILDVQGNAFASAPSITFNGTDLYFDFGEPAFRIAVNGVLNYSIGSEGVQMIIDSAFINTTNISLMPDNSLNCNCLTLNYTADFYSTAAGAYQLQGTEGGYGIGMGDDTVFMRTLVVNYACPPPTEILVHSILPETPSSPGQAIVSITHSGLPYNLIVASPSGLQVFQNQTALADFTIKSKHGTGFASILDRFGCTLDQSFSIPLCSIGVAIQIPAPDCDGQITGSLVVTPTNDYAPYQYIWSGPSNPGNTPTISQPLSGTYQVTVTDAIGCTATKTAIVESKIPLTISCQAQSGVSRVGATDGKASVAISGGKLPYRMFWSGPQQGNKQINQAGTTSITSLPAGSYTFQVVDKDGCSETCSLQIADVSCSISWDDITVLGPSCSGEVDGYINPHIKSGVGSVSYELNFGNTSLGSPPYQGLGPGMYLLSAVDGLGCRLDTVISLVDPSVLTVSCSLFFPVNSYQGENGVIAVDISGGTAPYEVVYRAGNSTQTKLFMSGGQQLLNSLSAGEYAITITDDRGCQVECQTTIPEFICTMQATITTRQPDCILPLGSLTIALESALEPVTYQWSGPFDPGNVPGSDRLPAGAYTVEITDLRGCVDTVSADIEDVFPLEGSCKVVQQETGWQRADGLVELAWSGKDSLVWLQLSGPDTLYESFDSSPIIIRNLSPGDYEVMIRQGDSCSVRCAFRIDAFLCAKGYTVDKTDLSCPDISDGTIGITKIVDSLVYTLILDDTTVYSLDDSYRISGLESGIHRIAVTLPDGCTFEDSLEIKSPEPLIYTIELTPASDSLAADGTIRLLIDGGMPPYQIVWADQVIGPFRDGLQAGPYSFSITDLSGCSKGGQVDLKSNDLLCAGLQSESEISPVSCPLAEDGIIDVRPLYGTAPYTISWDDGNSAFNRTGLKAGIYRYQWVDALGCPVYDSAVVEVLDDSMRHVEVVSLCPGTSLTWEMQVITSPGTYSHIYSNQWGCDSLVELMVLAIDLPEPLQVEIEEPSQCLVADGSIRIKTNGSFPGQFYLNGRDPVSQPDFENLSVGTYSISYRYNGCTGIVIDSLTLPAPELAWRVQIDTLYLPICSVAHSGAVRIELAGVNEEVRVLWPDGQEGLFADFLDPGMYQVLILGSQGCFNQAEVLIPEPEVEPLNLQPKSYTLCDGDRLDLSLDPLRSYHWSGPDGFSADTSEVILQMPGKYRIEAWHHGCFSVDSIEILGLDEFFDASFLVPQQVIAGEPFVAVENSWPVPDSIFWEVTGGAEISGTNLNQLTLQIPLPDTAVVTLTAWKGACSVTLAKSIIAYTDTSSFVNPQISPPSEIISVRLMPNPNQGVFRVKVTLNEALASQLRIYDPHGTLIESRDVAGQEAYEALFELSDLQPGLYTLAVQTPGDWKTVPFIVVL